MSEKASSYRDAFLFCVSQTGNLTMAAEFVGITRADVMADMRADPSFETDVQNGKEEAFDRLRYQTVQRAIEGIEVPRFSPASYNGPSPDRLDAAIWAITALLTGTQTMSQEMRL